MRYVHITEHMLLLNQPTWPPEVTEVAHHVSSTMPWGIHLRMFYLMGLCLIKIFRSNPDPVSLGPGFYMPWCKYSYFTDELYQTDLCSQLHILKFKSSLFRLNSGGYWDFTFKPLGIWLFGILNKSTLIIHTGMSYFRYSSGKVSFIWTVWIINGHFLLLLYNLLKLPWIWA